MLIDNILKNNNNNT